MRTLLKCVVVLGLCAAAPVRAAAAVTTPDSLPAPAAVVQRDSLAVKLNSFLRLGFSRLEQDDQQLARQAFDRALELAPGDAKAWIGVGRCYLEREDKRARLIRIVERWFNMDDVSRAIDCFGKAVELAPGSAETHYWLGSAYMRRYGRADLETALVQLQTASDLGGMNRDLGLKLASLNKALGNLDSAERVLSEVIESEKGRLDPLAGLELAKISLRRHNYDKAIRLYWRGVQAITTRAEFKAYWDDVVMLADEDEREQFDQTAPTQAEQFFRDFWFRRDHDLDLSPGMRLLRHYYRLAVADSLYHVPFAQRNPSLGPLAATYPEVDVPYDDRGLVYIRHGRPDRTLTQIGDGFLPNETWIYYRHDAPDLMLHFAGLNGNTEYQLVTALSSVVGRPSDFIADIDGNVYPRDDEEATRLNWVRELYASREEVGDGLYFRLLNHPGDPFALMEEEATNALAIRRALNSESVEAPYSHPLRSFYDLVGFRGLSGKQGDLEFYLGVPGQDISFSRQRDAYYYDIAFELMLYDSRWRQVGRIEKAEQHRSAINPHDLVDRLVLDLGRLDIPAGDYRYFIRIQNGESVGLFNGELRMDSFDGDSLQSSQILTAQNIFASPVDSSKFKRYGLEIYPNPSRVFHPTDKMFAYQEIYNLTPAADGSCRYRITYVVSTLRRDRNVFGAVLDTFKSLAGRGPGQEKVVLSAEKTRRPSGQDLVQEEVAIDISDNPDGLYELSVRVEDLNLAGRMTQRNTRFVVKR
ncbi:tetratricopeptide repeat protein [bacterium]|nr:tetratricopeptide repeat protein [bacterium]